MQIRMFSIAVVFVLLMGVLPQANGESIFLPVLAAHNNSSAADNLLHGYVPGCTSSHKSTQISLHPSSYRQGAFALSDHPNGSPILQSSLDVLVLSPEGPLEGDWWVWLVDANGSRISESVAVHTDATLGLGKCQQAAVVFYERRFDSSPVLRPLAWDSRLDRLGVYIVPAQSSPQQTIWHLIEAKWENEQEAGGNHHIYVEILDASGQRVVGQPVTIFWQGGSITGLTQNIPGAEYSFSYPMYKAGNSYNIKVESLWPSDALIGAGLGTPELPFHTFHTSFKLVFQEMSRP